MSHIYRTNQDSEFLFDTMIKLKELGANVEWQFIIFSFNEHQIEDAKKFCKDKKIKLLFKKSSRFAGERWKQVCLKMKKIMSEKKSIDKIVPYSVL